MCEVCVQLKNVRCINRVTMSDGACISVAMSNGACISVAMSNGACISVAMSDGACVSSLLRRTG